MLLLFQTLLVEEPLVTMVLATQHQSASVREAQHQEIVPRLLESAAFLASPVVELPVRTTLMPSYPPTHSAWTRTPAHTLSAN